MLLWSGYYIGTLLELSNMKQEGVCLRQKFWYSPCNVGSTQTSSVYKTDFVSDVRITTTFLIKYPFILVKE